MNPTRSAKEADAIVGSPRRLRSFAEHLTGRAARSPRRSLRTADLKQTAATHGKEPRRPLLCDTVTCQKPSLTCPTDQTPALKQGSFTLAPLESFHLALSAEGRRPHRRSVRLALLVTTSRRRPSALPSIYRQPHGTLYSYCRIQNRRADTLAAPSEFVPKCG